MDYLDIFLFDYLGKSKTPERVYMYQNEETVKPDFAEAKTISQDYELAQNVVFNKFLSDIFGFGRDSFSSPGQKEQFELWKIFRENQCWTMIMYNYAAS